MKRIDKVYRRVFIGFLILVLMFVASGVFLEYGGLLKSWL